MEHLAIDLGSKKSQICVRDSSGLILEEKRLDTRQLERVFAKRAPCRVILETCAEAFHVAELAQRAGHEVRVVPSSLARSMGIGFRGIKTDQRDARAISELSVRVDDTLLPSVYVPNAEARKHTALISSRQNLVAARTMHINHCRGWLRTQVGTIRRGSVTTFTKRMREVESPAHIEAVLECIDLLSTQIAKLDKEIKQLALADETCKRIMTVPGVGSITALRFVAAVGDVRRFRNSHALQSYFGLVPGERSSGERKQRTGINKAGNSQVRWLMIQAAWTAWRTRPIDPMSLWAGQIAKRRGKQIAAVALARKLVGILFAICRDGTCYTPQRSAEVGYTELAEVVATSHFDGPSADELDGHEEVGDH